MFRLPNFGRIETSRGQLDRFVLPFWIFCQTFFFHFGKLQITKAGKRKISSEFGDSHEWEFGRHVRSADDGI